MFENVKFKNTPITIPMHGHAPDANGKFPEGDYPLTGTLEEDPVIGIGGDLYGLLTTPDGINKGTRAISVAYLYSCCPDVFIYA